MAKQYRGKSLNRLASRGRGTCPVCYTTRTKLLYQRKKNDGTSITVCKKCTNVSAEQLNSIQSIGQVLPYRRQHRKAYNLQVQKWKQKEPS